MFFFGWAFARQACAAGASQSAGQEALYRVQRGGDAPDAFTRWFLARDHLLNAADALLWDISDLARSGRAGAAKRILAELKPAARDYGILTADASAESAASELCARLEALISGLPEQAQLPAQARRGFFSLDKDSAHRWVRLMRQSAIEAPGPKGSAAANLLIRASLEGRDVRIPALDLGGKLSGEETASLARAVGDAASFGAQVLVGRRRRWVRLADAEIYSCVAAAQAGGLVRVIARGEGGDADQARLYLLSKALYDADFAVSVENGGLFALLDGTRSRLDAQAVLERFEFAVRAVRRTRELAGRLPEYLQGTLSKNENAARLDLLARSLAAEGDLALAPGTRLADFAQEELAREGEREALRRRVERTLSQLRLPAFPPVPVGRRTLDLYYNEVMDAALARGELRPGVPVARNPGYDPLARLAREAKRLELRKSLRLAAAASDLDELGRVGDKLAQRGQWRLAADRWLVLYLLRPRAGGLADAAMAQLARARGAPQGISLEEAWLLLEQAGLLRPALRVEDVFSGRAGSSVSGELTYDRNKALLGGRIYAAPYATEADAAALSKSAGLVLTHGGPQSALLAAAAGVPVVELARAQWSSAGLSLDEPVFGPVRKVDGVELQDVAGRGARVLREGCKVRLDARLGVIELERPSLGSPQFERMQGALKAFDPKEGSQALAFWAAAQLREGALSSEGKRELAAALRLELRRRRTRGLSESDERRVLDVLKDAGY